MTIKTYGRWHPDREVAYPPEDRVKMNAILDDADKKIAYYGRFETAGTYLLIAMTIASLYLCVTVHYGFGLMRGAVYFLLYLLWQGTQALVVSNRMVLDYHRTERAALISLMGRRGIVSPYADDPFEDERD